MLFKKSFRVLSWYKEIYHHLRYIRPVSHGCYLFHVSHYCSASQLQNLNPKEQALVVERTNLISKVLKCDDEQAKEIINRNIYILVKNPQNVEKKAVFLKNHFALEDIINHSELLTLPLGPIQHQYHTMKEFGFQGLTCSDLLNYCGLIGTPPTQLIEQKRMPESCDPLRCVLSKLDLPKFSKLMTEEFPKERYMNSPILTLKRSLLPRYLGHLFSTSLEQGRFIVSLHHNLSGASFTSIKECLDILQDVYGFSIEKLRVNPYLLHQEPSNLFKIASLPSLMGGNAIEMAHKFPKVICSPVENLLEIETLLREKGFKDDVLQESRYVFSLSPETVRDLIIKRKIKKMVGR